MKDIPLSMDQLVRESRARIKRLRVQLGNPVDFDHLVRGTIEEALKDYDPKVRAFTLKAIFGG